MATRPATARQIVWFGIALLLLSAPSAVTPQWHVSADERPAEEKPAEDQPAAEPAAPAQPVSIILLDNGQVVDVQAEAAQEVEAPPKQPSAREELQTKLQKQVTVRLNKVSVKNALDQLAKEHDFKYRLDAETLARAKIDIEAIQTGVNMRRRPLARVLRELLTPHNLRVAIADDTLLVTELPPLPQGQKRRRAGDNDLLEIVVLGNVIVSDNQVAARRTVAREVVPRQQAQVLNDQQKQMIAQLKVQFTQQFLPALRSELALSFASCRATDEQKKLIRKDARKAFDEAIEKYADIQGQMMVGGWRGGQPNYPNVREEVQKAVVASIEQHVGGDQIAAYQHEVAARSALRRQATIRNMVATMDRQLVLSGEQRQKLTEKLETLWKPAWMSALEYMQWDGNNVFPTLPDDALKAILNDAQRKIWQSTGRTDPSQIWGGGNSFGFFQGGPIADGEEADDGVEVNGQIIFAQPAIAVEQAVVVEEVKAENAQPAGDQSQPAEPQPEGRP